MTCETCGEKPKKCGNCNKDFPRAVIEINNPEALTLLRKVVIPVSMGTEEQVPPAVGKYHNVLLYYEANKHIYIYSSDGIPTMIESEIPQDLIDRIANLEDDVEDLQEEFDEFKNSPDVVDIVATYADLEAYDTSDLGDKDVIRVLADETHDNESSYYRWSTTTQTWTFIGATGPYYTKDETNTLLGGKLDASTTFWGQTANNGEVKGSLIFEGNPLTTGTDISLENDGSLTIHAGGANWVTFKKTDNILENEVNFSMATIRDIANGQNDTDAVNVRQLNASVGKAKVLSTSDYNWNSVAHSTADPKDSIALWLLAPGIYTVPNGLNAYVYNSPYTTATNTTYIVGAGSTWGVPIIMLRGLNYSTIGWECGTFYLVNSANGAKNYEYAIGSVIDGLDGEPYTNRPLSAKQGYVLSHMIGNLDNLETDHKSNLVSAVNELQFEIPLIKDSAPVNTDAGHLGQLLTDTTNMHTYQCTAIDRTDPDNPLYTWTLRW